MAISIPSKYQGWWRITETDAWINDRIDMLGQALISFTGKEDRLRMHCLLARLKAIPTKDGLSFIWQGAWEYDEMAGSGSVWITDNEQLEGELHIDNGDSSMFWAKRVRKPKQPLQDPPSYYHKWHR